MFSVVLFPFLIGKGSILAVLLQTAVYRLWEGVGKEEGEEAIWLLASVRSWHASQCSYSV